MNPYLQIVSHLKGRGLIAPALVDIEVEHICSRTVVILVPIG